MTKTNLALKWCSCFLAFCPGVLASPETQQKYLELLQKHPVLAESPGSAANGEIEIRTDPEEMAAIERTIGRHVGLVAADRYWTWINDACLFPNGNQGVYGRILWSGDFKAQIGVAILPVTESGHILMNLNFRHATRSWELELPRGCLNPGEKPAEAAKRELHEETGCRASEMIYLGQMPPDSGLTNSVIPVYLAKISEQSKASPEDAEAIAATLPLTIKEIKQSFVRGYCECQLNGKMQKIPLRDPFLAFALLIYETKLNDGA